MLRACRSTVKPHRARRVPRPIVTSPPDAPLSPGRGADASGPACAFACKRYPRSATQCNAMQTTGSTSDMTQSTTRLNVNGRGHDVKAAPDTPLLYVLRNDLGLNGPKYGCGLGECGACAVLVDDHAARSCVVSVGALARKSVTTLEGLGTAAQPHPVQAAFIRHQAAQCGY